MGQAARVGLGLGEGVFGGGFPNQEALQERAWVSIQTALEEEGGAEGWRGRGVWGHQPLARALGSTAAGLSDGLQELRPWVLSLPRYWILLVIWECRR